MYLPCEPKSWTNERYVPEHPPRSKEQVSRLLKFMHKLLAKDVPKVVIVRYCTSELVNINCFVASNTSISITNVAAATTAKVLV